MIHALNAPDTLCISPAGITAGATSAVNIDTLGADWATIRVALSNIVTTGVASADGVTVKLTESVDTNSSNATTFVADRTGIKFGREIRYEVDTRTRKRYLRLSVIPGTSGVSNEPVTACAFSTLSRKAAAPASTSDLIAGTNDAVVIT
jgi:hypothetical protein